MPIEIPTDENAMLVKKSGLDLVNNPLNGNNIYHAGEFKVKHQLMDENMIIVGFIIFDSSFNQEDFIIKGLEIRYKDKNGDETYNKNKIIYTKMLIDNKCHHFSYFFKDNEEAIFRKSSETIMVKKIDDVYKFRGSNGFYYSYSGDEKFKFYMFLDRNSNSPECATNESVFAVCKFMKDGRFQHAIFNFHELIRVDNS